MTQEEKKLLLIDLCARLFYGVKINVPHHYEDKDAIITLDAFWLHDIQNGRKEIKPYLRPMSSMTDKEKYEYRHMLGATLNSEKESIMFVYVEDFPAVIDWLNSHHFDYRGLIDKELALESPENMYKNNQKL